VKFVDLIYGIKLIRTQAKRLHKASRSLAI